MKILSLDLGTQLGWARTDECGLIHAGTLVLAGAGDLKWAKKIRLDRRLDIRIKAFSLWLEAQPAEICVFEDVRFASSQAQAHLWGSLRGAVWSWAARRNIVIDCFDTGKLKKWATGSGAADKPAMEAAVRGRWPALVRPGYDDNTYDAICLLQWARETIKI